MQKLQSEKKSAKEFVERRYEDWNENYELFRNKVKTNRLTQRQNVNIPLMKETIKTLLSKVDDAPGVEWKDLGGDSLKELMFQEIWNDNYDRLNLEGVDIQDKKTVLLYGRAFKKLNWADNKLVYLFLVMSAILLLTLHFVAIPLIIILYILVSIVNNIFLKKKV